MFKNNFRYFLLFLMFGLLITYEARILSMGVKYISVENLQESVQQVEKERAELEQIRLSLDYTDKKLEEYADLAWMDDETYLRSLNTRVKDLEKILNLTDVEGPGVIIIIDDGDRDLFLDENRNNVLVHDQDISIIVDELIEAGAEALSVNGERVIFNDTEIICVGPTVKVNGEQMSAPFIIRAIGNRKYLEAAINAPETYANYLDNYGLFVEVNTSVSVRIKRFDGDVKTEFLRYYEEGGN